MIIFQDNSIDDFDSPISNSSETDAIHDIFVTKDIEDVVEFFSDFIIECEANKCFKNQSEIGEHLSSIDNSKICVDKYRLYSFTDSNRNQTILFILLIDNINPIQVVAILDIDGDISFAKTKMIEGNREYYNDFLIELNKVNNNNTMIDN